MRFFLKSVRLLSIAVPLLCCAPDLQGQVIKKNFKPRTSNQTSQGYRGLKNYRIQGDFAIIGNTSLMPQDGSQNNKRAEMINAGSGIFNHSTAEFRLPDNLDENCTEIVYAGLYWSGRAANIRFEPQVNDYVIEWFRRLARLSVPRLRETEGSARGGGDGLKPKEVVFHTPKVAKRLTASEIHFDYQDSDGLYTAYFDVTNLVRESRTGMYGVADIASNGGTDLTALKHGLSAGWGMVIIYQNPALPMKDIITYDGFGFMKPVSGTDVSAEVTMSGFKAASEGGVKVKLGVMAVEGDRDEKGDYFQMRNQLTGGFENLSHANNTSDNFFNSSIFTGNNKRVRERPDSFGTDVAIFDLDNVGNKYIKNQGDQTVFRFGSTSDVFALYSITMSVDADLPQDYVRPQFASVLNPVTRLCENTGIVLEARANVKEIQWEYNRSGIWKKLPDAEFANVVPSGSGISITDSHPSINGMKIRAKIQDGICWLYNETQIEVENGIFKQPQSIAVLEGKNGTIQIDTQGKKVFWEYWDINNGSWKIVTSQDFENHLIPLDYELKVQKADKRLKDLKVRAVINERGCHMESSEAIIKIKSSVQVISNPMLFSGTTKSIPK